MAERLRILVLLPLFALALVAAGCGSSDSQTAAGSTSAGGSTSAFQECLASKGVELPAGFGNGQPPQGGQPPQDGQQPAFSAEQQKAFAECQSKLPAGAQGGPPGSGQQSGALTEYTNCLREHGVTFGQTNSQSEFEKARKACAEYAPDSGG